MGGGLISGEYIRLRADCEGWEEVGEGVEHSDDEEAGERHKVETQLLKLKEEAIEALPERLRVMALEIDLKPLLEDRLMATLTPPIQGYGEKAKEAA